VIDREKMERYCSRGQSPQRGVAPTEEEECASTPKVAICTDTRRRQDGSVGIATRYGLDGPGIEFRLRRDFPPTPSFLQNVYRIILGGKGAVA
jgi:hypothetical protein